MNLSNATFKGNLIAEKGFTFDGINGISFTPATATTGSIYRVGPGGGNVPLSSCLAPSQDPLFFFAGRIQLYDATLGHAVTLGSDGAGSTLETEGANNGFKINFYCGKDVAICTGISGGIVAMGKEVEMAQSLRIGANPTPSGIDLTTSIEINQNTNNGNGIKVQTWNNSIKAFSISNTNFVNSPPFVVYGDGRTEINTTATTAFIIRDASNPNPNTNINFKVKNNGFVYAREVNVQIGPFGDYVFKKDYKLLPLEEVEKYIKENHHLKGFENASYYQNNGMPLGEVVRLQQVKIEELTLYLIELKKEVEKMKK